MLDGAFKDAVTALLNGNFDVFNVEMEKRAKSEDALDAARRLAEAKIVQDCFGTPAGRRCLDWLIGKTMLQGENAAQATATTAEAYAIASAKREGQKQIVATIIDALQYARGETKELSNADA